MANMTRFAIRRYATIILTLARFGIRSLHLYRFTDWIRGRPKRVSASRARELRLMFESLGGTFVKFGQIMAMRPDLLPPDYVEELSILFDDAPVFDSRLAIRMIESELGRPVSELFQTFDDKPLAAASFAQVHRADLWSGEKVVVKVQRPGLRKLIDTDLKLIRLIAFLIDASGAMRHFRIRPLVGDFTEWTNEELDYLTEASYAASMRSGENDNRYEYIPKVFWDYTTATILVLEYLEGHWVSDILNAIETGNESRLRELDAAGIDLTVVASNIFNSGLHQAFEEEIFHADPHAGNLVVLADNRIGYIDFGIMGRLGDKFKRAQLRILSALEEGNLDRYVEGVMQLFSPPPENVDVEQFQELLKRNARRWMNNFHNPKATLFERSSAAILSSNMSLARQYNLSYSHVAVRYYRALLVSEMIVLRLNKSFDFRQSLRTYFVRYGMRSILRENSPQRKFLNNFRRFQVIRELPETMQKSMDLLDREVMSVKTAVGQIRLALATVFEILAFVNAIGFVIVTVIRVFWPSTYARLIHLSWTWVLVIVIILTPFLAWASRMTSIGSVHRGKFIKYR